MNPLSGPGGGRAAGRDVAEPPCGGHRSTAATRVPSGRDRDTGADFERLLREKAARREDDEVGDAGPAPAATPPSALAARRPPAAGEPANAAESLAGTGGGSGSPRLQPDPSAGPSSPAASAAESDALKAMRAAIESGFGGLSLAAGPAGAAAQQWQVSLAPGGAAALELQATRLPASLPGGPPAAWSLTLSAPDAALLARHLPRLDERLRARRIDAGAVQLDTGGESAEGAAGGAPSAPAPDGDPRRRASD